MSAEQDGRRPGREVDALLRRILAAPGDIAARAALRRHLRVASAAPRPDDEDGETFPPAVGGEEGPFSAALDAFFASLDAGEPVDAGTPDRRAPAPTPADVALGWLAAAGAVAAPGAHADVAPLGVVALELDDVALEPTATARLGPSTCAFLDLVPVRHEGERGLVVAVADGTDLAGRLGALALLVDLEVRAVSASRPALARACARCAAAVPGAAASVPGAARRGPSRWSPRRRVPGLRRAGEAAPGGALDRVPAELARALRIVPLRLASGSTGLALVVAHERGLARARLEGLLAALDVPVVGVEAPPAAIDLALDRLIERPRGVAPRGPMERARVRTDADVLFARAEQAGLDVADLDGVEVEPRVIAMVPRAFAETYRVCPLATEGEVLVVALADPTNAQVLDDLRFMLDREVRGAMAQPAAVDRAIQRHYVADGADRPGGPGPRTAARRREDERTAAPPRPRGLVAALVGPSAAAEQARAWIARLAPRGAPAAVVGEAGTDRAHLARALHASGPRAHGPLLEVSCRGVEASALLAELLGWSPSDRVPGGRGARREPVAGALERATGGTLILRDADRLPDAVQARLLDVVRCGYVAHGRRRVDVRLVFTLRRAPAELVEAGCMQALLGAQLAGGALALAPLRERRDDLEPLVAALIADAGPPPEEAWRLRPWAVERLRRHAWPGNLHELRGVVASLVARRLARHDGPARLGPCPAASPVRGAPGPRPACPGPAHGAPPGHEGRAGPPSDRPVVDATFADADVRAALATIAARAGKGLRVGPGVLGRVTVELVGVPWLTALRLVARAGGGHVVEEDDVVIVRQVVRAVEDDVLVAIPALDEVVAAVPVEDSVRAIPDLDGPAPPRLPARLTFDDDDPDREPYASSCAAGAPGLVRLVLEARETFAATRVTLLVRDGDRVRRVSVSAGADDRRALGGPERRLIESVLALGRPTRLVADELGLGVARGTEVLVLPLDLPGARHPGALIVEALADPRRSTPRPAWAAPQVLEGLADLFSTLLADALGDSPTPADDLAGPAPPARLTPTPAARSAGRGLIGRWFGPRS